MRSAFGVEHGAVSKALSPTQMADALKAQHSAAKAAKAVGRRPKNPVGRGRMTNAQLATQGTNPNAVTRPQGVKNFFNRIGETDISIKGVGRATGRGIKHTGRFVEKHPGLTGTALVGGGGYGGYRYLNNREPPKKKKRSTP